MLFLEHQIVIFSTEFSLKLSDLKSDFTLTLGYLNPAFNNPALQFFRELDSQIILAK